VLRAGAAAGLALSAIIHLQLAPGYQQAAPGGLGQGALFLIQAGTAGLAAVFVLSKGSRTAFAAAAVVALSSLAAVILYRYVQVPAIGPLPSMYEPVWYAAKVVTAVAEAAAGGPGSGRVRPAAEEPARATAGVKGPPPRGFTGLTLPGPLTGPGKRLWWPAGGGPAKDL
jgi:hypothetical protein